MMRSLVLSIIVLAGCGGADAGACSTRSDCPLGRICLDGRCVAGTDGGEIDAGDANVSVRDAQPLDVVCAAIEEQAREIRRPIDAIVLPDESPSMGAARDAVAAAMETTFRTSMESAGVDYHVIWHGLTPLPTIEATGRLTRNGVQLGSGDDAMFVPVLNSYDAWRPALRDDAIKVFIHFADATSGQGAQISGYSGTFDEVLIGREPALWGTTGNYNFIYHTFVGLPINAPPELPYAPADPVVAGTCSGAFVNPVPLQEMARRTGGLRFPLCLPERFDSVFRAIADSAIERAAVRCELELPEPSAGMTLDLATVAVRYYAGAGGEEVLRRAASSAECSDAGFLIEGGTRMVLCPAACARIEADPNARLTVLSGCSPELY